MVVWHVKLKGKAGPPEVNPVWNDLYTFQHSHISKLVPTTCIMWKTSLFASFNIICVPYQYCRNIVLIFKLRSLWYWNKLFKRLCEPECGHHRRQIWHQRVLSITIEYMLTLWILLSDSYQLHTFKYPNNSFWFFNFIN